MLILDEREKLPDPWIWCPHQRKQRCDGCDKWAMPKKEQVVEYRGEHYHAACALEIALRIISQPPPFRRKNSPHAGVKE